MTKRHNKPKQAVATEKPEIAVISASLDDCLKDMAERFDLPVDELIAAAHNAPYAEKRMEGLNYPDATGTPDERRVWYALARVLKPAHIVEVGVLWGVSTIQWLSALRDNQHGAITAVDINTEIEGGRKPGHLIPDVLRNRLTLHYPMNGKDYFSADKAPIDLFFEDASHEYESTKAIHAAAKVQLAPDALCVAHDSISRPEIIRAFVDIGITPTIYRINDSNYGLAIWRNR